MKTVTAREFYHSSKLVDDLHAGEQLVVTANGKPKFVVSTPPVSPFGKAKMPSRPETKPARPLSLLSVVIPARKVRFRQNPGQLKLKIVACG